MSRWMVEADLDLCQGHQECQLEAPQIFGWDDVEKKVTVLQAHPADELRLDADHAVRHCPAMALSIQEDS
jgi:ferredoxin